MCGLLIETETKQFGRPPPEILFQFYFSFILHVRPALGPLTACNHVDERVATHGQQRIDRRCGTLRRAEMGLRVRGRFFTTYADRPTSRLAMVWHADLGGSCVANWRTIATVKITTWIHRQTAVDRCQTNYLCKSAFVRR